MHVHTHTQWKSAQKNYSYSPFTFLFSIDHTDTEWKQCLAGRSALCALWKTHKALSASFWAEEVFMYLISIHIIHSICMALELYLQSVHSSNHALHACLHTLTKSRVCPSAGSRGIKLCYSSNQPACVLLGVKDSLYPNESCCRGQRFQTKPTE